MLRDKIAKLAADHPEFRELLVPLLKKGGFDDIPYNPSSGEVLLASNSSVYSWEYKENYRYALVLLDIRSGQLNLKIVEKRVDTGYKPSTRVQTLDEVSLGTLMKPKLGAVAALLKSYGHSTTRASSGFTRVWRYILTGTQAPLSTIIDDARQNPQIAKSNPLFRTEPTPEELRETLKDRIDKLSPDQLKALFDRMPK